MKSTTTQGLLSPAQAAEQLGVTEKTIRRHIANKRLKAVRLGPRLLRIDPEDLRALMQPAAPEVTDEIDAELQAIIDAAPPLSDQQRVALAELLRPARIAV